MDLRETGIGKGSALLPRPVGGRYVAAAGIGREIEDIAVASGRQHDGLSRMRSDLAGDEIAHDDPPRVAVNDDQIGHFRPRMDPLLAAHHLPAEGGIGAEQELLARLTPAVKRAGHLDAPERAVGQLSAIFAGKRHAERHALIDDLGADLCQAVDVRFARTEVAALDRVIKQPLDAVAVVLIILRRIDAALRRDTVRAAGAVLKAETIHVIAELSKGRRRAGARQPRSHHDDADRPFVRWTDQLFTETVTVPFAVERS